MKNKTKNMKTKSFALIIIALMITSIAFIAMPIQQVKAAEVTTSGPLPAGKTPAFTTPTVCSLSAKPSLVGVGQYILVNVWINPSVTTTRVVKTYIFTITKPDGTNTTWSQDAEPATGATWFDYTLDQVGVWRINVHFTGCYFNGTTTEATQSAYYQPSSAPEQNITCQEALNPSWPPSPIPTDYWTRPVDFGHREWWPILGNYPANGYDGTGDPTWNTVYPDTNPHWSSQYGLIPWVQAPKSAHIAWLSLDQPAGEVGGQMGYGAGDTIASDLSTSPLLCNLAYAGRGYRTVTKPEPTVINGTTYLQPTSVWECFDIRTGKVYWDLTGMQIPTFIEYTNSTTTAAISEGAVTANLVYLSASRLVKYNPVTGAVTANVSVDMSGTYYRNPYVLSVQNIGNTTNPDYHLINWTISGTSATFASRVISNVSYAASSLPSVIDWNAGLGGSVTGITTAGVMSGVIVTGSNLWTGQLLWNHTIPDVTLYSGSCTVADHGKIAFNLQRVGNNLGCYMAYDLLTGTLAWKSPSLDYPWSSTGFGAYGVASAYGVIIHTAYDGIYAINWTNGQIAWVYHKYALAPFESPYTDANGIEVYSFNSGVRIADGIVFTYNCEHTTTFPRTRGWSTVAVNMTTGKEIWSIALPGNAAFGNSPDIGAVVDGYMLMMSDLGYFVAYGKGLSATTVTAPDVVLPRGTGVVIKGTVLDQSPAQPDTPCVSKDSMTLEMEYLHLQNSISGLWGNETVTGVPVKLTAIDSNNNVLDIGTVTTNGYYGTFSCTWTPPNEGNYTVIASFAGDDSYGSSSAATGLSVSATPVATATPTATPTTVSSNQPTTTDLLTYLVVGIIAIIIAIAIVGALILRKH